jgi:hypothetical protein
VTSQWDAAAVLAASNEWVWVPEGARQAGTEAYVVMAPPEFMPLPAMVRVFGSDASPSDLIEEVETIVRGWGRDRLSWRVSDLTRPADLEADLLRRGGVIEERMDVLGLPIADGLPDFGVPPGVEVRRVDSEGTARDHFSVSNDAFGYPPAPPELVKHNLAEMQAGLQDDSGGEVVAYVDRQPAGTGGWTLAGPVCRLWGGSTHSGLRGRGAYRAVLAQRLRIARSAGATLGLTHGKVETSAPILRRLGFSRFGEERVVAFELT